MAQHSSYSAADVTATLDGRMVVGFDEGDNALEIAPGAERGSGRVGATGSSIWSQSTNKSATITLRLMHTSATHRFLAQKEAQMQGGVRRPFAFQYKDVGSGEGGTAAQCYISAAPTVQKGQTATVREWVLWTGEYKADIPNEAQ